MARFMLLVALTAVALFNLALAETLKVDVVAVDNVQKFLEANPGARIVPVKGQPVGKASFRYTLGQRVNGDKLVAQGSDGYQYSKPQDVQVTISYPTSGTGAVVSYVEILVSQSSSVGTAYVVSGGVGQRSVRIIVEAKSTTYVNWSAQIYGW